jgi:hypothetical protein
LNFFWFFSGLGGMVFAEMAALSMTIGATAPHCQLTEGAVIGAILDFERPEKNDHPRSGYL